MKRFLAACAATLALSSAHAGDITFTNAVYDVTAITQVNEAGSPPVAFFDSQVSPPTATPIFASADASGLTDIATAGAIAGPGLLTTSADVTAIVGVDSATALAHFTGSFVLGAAEPFLSIDFTPFNFATGASSGATRLFLTLTSAGSTLFSDYITSSWQRRLTPGTLYGIDLTLGSDASGGFGAAGTGEGNASTAGIAAITSAVPLPAPWLLFAVGAPLIAARRRAAARKS